MPTGPAHQRRVRRPLGPFGEPGYGGPRPPAGHGLHRYYLWVYTFDTHVGGTLSRRQFLDGYADHVIEQNRTVDVYEN